MFGSRVLFGGKVSALSGSVGFGVQNSSKKLPNVKKRFVWEKVGELLGSGLATFFVASSIQAEMFRDFFCQGQKISWFLFCYIKFDPVVSLWLLPTQFCPGVFSHPMLPHFKKYRRFFWTWIWRFVETFLKIATSGDCREVQFPQNSKKHWKPPEYLTTFPDLCNHSQNFQIFYPIWKQSTEHFPKFPWKWLYNFRYRGVNKTPLWNAKG